MDRAIFFFFLTGEYFVSLKGYKIPLKSTDKPAHQVNNPPPPGTEDEIPSNNQREMYASPLAAVQWPQQQETFENIAPVQPPTFESVPTNPETVKSSTKRGSLFSKLNQYQRLFSKGKHF